MQATTERRKNIAIPSDERTKMVKMPALGTVIKVGMIAGGGIAAGVMIAYYLRKRSLQR